MIKITYKTLDCGVNGWSIVTYVNKQYSHTRSGLTEYLAKSMVARFNQFNA